MSGQFPPQPASEVLHVPNGQLEFPGLILWLANIGAKTVEKPQKEPLVR